MRHRYLFLFGALAILACVQLFQGCQIAGPVSSGNLSGRLDSLQEEIWKQPSESQDGLHSVSATPVLKYIPLGTAIEQAKAVMEAHGFRCSSDNQEGRCRLVCVASRNIRLMVADVIRVSLYHEAGRITDVKVITFVDAP